ncbi:hypothetical protein ACFQ51_48155 [Streptomyces kaempferi]
MTPVAFGGIHSSLPSWSGARVGDEVYALHVNRCVVFVVSRMRVIDMERRDCCGNAPETRQDPAFPGHGDWSMLGAAAAAPRRSTWTRRPYASTPRSPAISWRGLPGETAAA